MSFPLSSQLNRMTTLKKKDVYTRTPPTPSTTFSSSVSSSSPSSSASPSWISTVSPPGSTRSVLDLILSSTLRSTDVASAPQPEEDEPSPTTVRRRSDVSRWVSAVEGYVILRDLDRYLCRLVRDYTLLRAKS